MQFKGPLLVVKDINVSRKFYEQLLQQKVRFDFGANIMFEGGLSLQERSSFAQMTTISEDEISQRTHNMELYFEIAELDHLIAQISQQAELKYLHPVMKHPWEQRVIRFYDPDDHIIEVGECMESVVKRLLVQGLSLEETAQRTQHPLSFVKEVSERHQHLCLQTDRLDLRVLEAAAAKQVLTYYQRNREFLAPWEAVKDEEFFTLSAQQNQLQNELQSMREGRLFKVWLFLKAKPEVIGSIALNNIVRGAFQSCHLGYKLSAEVINQGLMSEALAEVINYAFTKLQLHRLEANIMPRNKRSLRVVEKLGFYNEGLAEKYLNINGKWEDHLHLVLRNPALE